MTVQATPAPTTRVTPAARASRARRVGCGAAVILWFLLLLTPCGLLLIAVTGEVTIPTGSLPGQETRLWLIMEADQRGLGISTAGVQSQSETRACLQINSRFLLWQGRADSVSYCECFTRTDAVDSWGYSGMNEGVCVAAD